MATIIEEKTGLAVGARGIVPTSALGQDPVKQGDPAFFASLSRGIPEPFRYKHPEENCRHVEIRGSGTVVVD